MYAIVATGGKQYKVAEGGVLEVEKLDAQAGDTVALNVVFIADGATITTDSTELAQAKVFAEVVEHFKGEKKLIFKFKKRKGYKRLRGHRQNLTRLKIVCISLTGEAPKSKDSDTDEAIAIVVEETVDTSVVEEAPAVKKTTKKAAAKKVVEEEAVEAEVPEKDATEKKPVRRASTKKPAVAEPAPDAE